jgi:glycosyltransferase involved in cell wall biosynthesis
MSYKISVIMPALNEGQNIAAVIEETAVAFKALSINGEIIVINDGSTDDTSQVVTEMMERYSFLRMLSNGKPEGIGAGFWKGVKNSSGEIVTLIPSDGETYAIEILRYLPLMDHVDVLVPFFFNKELRTWSRRLISKTYKAIINVSFGLLLNYMNGTVVYRRAILDDIDLKTPGFFYQTELLIKTLKRGYLFAEVPCALKLRGHGTSTALKPKSFYHVIKGYLSTMLAIYFLDIPTKNLDPRSMSFTRKRQISNPKIVSQDLQASDFNSP